MVPYSAGPWEFETEHAGEECVLLKVPARGHISAIRLKQLNGDPTGATFEVFTNEDCCAAAERGEFSESSQGVDAVDIVGSREAYSVFGVKTLVSGNRFEEYGKDYPYQNKDGGGPTNRKRRLYLAITPSANDTQVRTWEFSLEILMPTTV